MEWLGELDLLLAMLHANHLQQCQLQAQIQVAGKDPSGRRKHLSCSVTLLVQQGQVQTCQILHAGKVLFEGEEALKRSRHAGTCSWKVAAQLEEISPLAFPSHSRQVRDGSEPGERKSQPDWLLGPPPRQISQLSPKQLARLPRKHRQVYLLVDGQRSVSQISSLLQCDDIGHVLSLLTELENWHLITFAGEGRRR
ncbi:MAG TPA: hypothetical protein VFB12_22040 [Ktedonobacteraceae bacterium]|nr:hypothetical protein [Ktedonobacteraceae bacterium]